MVVPSRAVTVTVNVGSGVGSVSSAARVQWSSDARASVSYRAAFTRMVSRRAEIILKVGRGESASYDDNDDDERMRKYLK